jgi:hypothetical protein
VAECQRALREVTLRSRMMRLPAAILFAVLVLATSYSRADSSLSGKECPQLPGAPSDWTEQEHWVWLEVCAGREANLRIRYGGSRFPGNVSDWQETWGSFPGGAANWPRQRLLRPRLLETILLDERYRGSIPRQGVRIIGARFDEAINLSRTKLDRVIWFHESRFERDVDLSNLVTLYNLSLIRTIVIGNLDMDEMQAANVILTDAILSNLQMRGAKVDGNLTLENTIVTGETNLLSLNIGRHILASNSRLAGVSLTGGRIGGDVRMFRAVVTRRFRLQSLNVAGDLFLRGATVLDGDRPEIADLTFLTVGGSLDVSASYLPVLNLTGAKIGYALYLGSRIPASTPTKWQPGASLILRGASARALQDRLEKCGKPDAECIGAWPDNLELDGFTYQQLGALAVDASSDMAARSTAWWVAWLRRQVRFSPQPYEQAAVALRREGHEDTAIGVLYEMKKREMAETRLVTRKVWLMLLHVFIGFGYRIYYAVWWVLGFIVTGIIVLNVSGEGRRNKMPYGLIYSIDMLLPFTKLRESNSKIELAGAARYYFYFHKIMGFVLSSFLIAGLSGLTK